MSISDEERRAFTEHDMRALLDLDGADPPSEVRAWEHLGEVLGSVLDGPFRHGVASMAETSVPDCQGPVETAIVLRARTRDIRDRVLGHDEAVRRAFRVLESLCRQGTWHRRAEAVIALSLAADQARCLCDRLVGLPVQALPRPAALAAALVTALDGSGRALEAARSRLREMAEPAGPTPEAVIPSADALAAARTAIRIATRLEAEVRAEAVDASGVDLSRLDLTDPGILVGVVWTDTTVWPHGMAQVVRARSNRIAAGVYQVRRTRG
ncbi:hypothetical protein [Embleya sp. NBC_00896]|uniref:hypothetical protein n=1 Tax=Embleya sp. NBC_00896 TaxID=2975961 RepID=UPI002F90B996|nr:hypothetical protein OG928_40160 [Embleya sp. NBC_00896]